MTLIKAATFECPKPIRWLLVTSQAATVMTLSAELTLWMNAIIALCLIWQCAFIAQVLPQPNKYIIMLIAILGAVSIAVSGLTLGLLLSMIHLVCFAFAIKTMEMHSRKDFFQLILLSIFILGCAFIFNQSVWFAALIFTLICVNLAIFVWYFAPKNHLLASIKTSASLLTLSIPLALTMFVLFPRLQPFWQMPTAKSASIGLSDSVSPGDIANLARSKELAFRVEFFGEPPRSSNLYWRAITLPVYNGRSWQRYKGGSESLDWRKTRQLSARESLTIDKRGGQYTYQVFAEPSYKRWLFGLDLAQVNNPSIFQMNDYSLLAKKPVAKTLAYEVLSFHQSPLELNMPKVKQQWYLSLPGDANPKLAQYGLELRNQYQSPEQIIQHVLNQFRQQSYFYTLNPPMLMNNSLDQFFFDTKTGFCEHYASSFAFLMRAAGIPTRLVTGYMGGELNPQGNYFSIYQYDAHAWTEVWLEGKGWMRIDPTGAVSPERISQGGSTTLTQERLALSNALFDAKSFPLFAQLSMHIEAIDYQWTRLVVGYTMEKQSQFLKQLLGQGRFIKVVSLFIGVLLIVVSVFWLINTLTRDKAKHTRWHKELNTLLTWMGKRGFKRSTEQTLQQFLTEVGQKIGDKHGLLHCVWLSFYRLNYQALNEQEQANELQHLKKHIKNARILLKQQSG